MMCLCMYESEKCNFKKLQKKKIKKKNDSMIYIQRSRFDITAV